MAAPQIESVLAPATADSGSSINIDVTAIDPAALTVTWTATATNTVTNEVSTPVSATTAVGDPFVIVLTSDSNAVITAGATPGTFVATFA